MVVENEIIKKDDYIHFIVKGFFENFNIDNEIINYSQRINECIDEYNCANLLLDVSKLDYEINTSDRYRIGVGINNLFLKNFTRIACLRNPKIKDDFAEIVAHNRGAIFKFFNDEEKAIKWLKLKDKNNLK